MSVNFECYNVSNTCVVCVKQVDGSRRSTTECADAVMSVRAPTRVCERGGAGKEKCNDGEDLEERETVEERQGEEPKG